MTDRRTKPGGFTLVELMVVVLIIALLIAILLPALARARAYARMMACASNMRQFGIAVTNYAVEQDDKMLPVDQNYWHYLAPYMGESNAQNAGSEVFRCGVDQFLTEASGSSLGGAVNAGSLSDPGVEEGYSYAANYAARVNLDSVTLHASSDLSTPFSYADKGRLRRLGGAAPDTFLFIESWGECVGDLDDFTDGNTVNQGFDEGVVNRIMLGVPDPHNLTGGSLSAPGWRMRPAIQDYDDTDNALTLNPVKRTFSKDDGNNSTCTHHWLLSQIQTEQSYDDAFHVGVVNVLSADGSVAQQEVIRLGQIQVGADNRWTRLRD